MSTSKRTSKNYKLSKFGKQLIKEFEGCCLKAYKDSAGVWTIGYGHTGYVGLAGYNCEVKEGMVITQAQANTLLDMDLQKFVDIVNNSKSYLTFKINQHIFDALVSFSFNCGEGNLKTLVTGRDRKTVSEKIVLYCKAGGKELEGLKIRRRVEKILYDTPV